MQIIHKDILASQTYGATFSFDIGNISSRVTFPDRAYYNSSGTLNVVNPVSTYSSDYAPWVTNYELNPWTAATSLHTAASPFYSMQVRQVSSNSTMSLPAGTILMTRMNSDPPYDIILDAYSNESNLFITPLAGFPHTVDTVGGDDNELKPNAMVLSKTRAYFFWLNNNRIHMSTFNGSSYSADIVLSNTDVDDDIGIGLSGCIINSSGTEYISLVYPITTSEIGLVTFKDGDFAATSTERKLLSTITSTQTAISQNPRTGKIYLSWMDGSIAYYKECSYSEPNSWLFGPSQAIDSTWQDVIYGMSVSGFSNFETAFSLPSRLGDDNVIKDVLLRSSASINTAFLPYNGISCLFPYSEGGKSYVGLVIMYEFDKFRFYKRLLKYPSELVWEKSKKLLHLQGPPILNSNVSIEVDYAELATSSCIIENANAAGGRSAIYDSTDVIASAGNLITLTFDKDMKQADYNSLVNNQIKLYASDNSTIALAFHTGNANSLSFKTVADLDLSSNYRIDIASDVFDNNGSQIWGPSRLSFKTQNIQSGVLASEVRQINAFKNLANTIPINNNEEINATSTVYIRLTSIDPAYNTIDLATVSVYLNGSFIQDIELAQKNASSLYFFGQYSVSAPTGGSNLYELRTASSTVKHSLKVDYPIVSSVNPPNASFGVKINVNPKINFSEDILSSSVSTYSVRLSVSGVPANYSTSTAGNVITINPNDTSEGYLLPDTTYTVSVGYQVQDLTGNPFVNLPATYTSTFTTQASQTEALSISQVKLFSDPTYTTLLSHNSDYFATSTIYIEMIGVDAENLTRDYTLASISTGLVALLTETASSTGIYRGATSFSSLPDNFALKVQSVKSPVASASLLITYPHVMPNTPASGSVNIPVDSIITIDTSEVVDISSITAANAKLMLNGVSVGVVSTYNAVTKKIFLTPTSPLGSEQTYLVTIQSLKDIVGNLQTNPVHFSFTTEDIIPPTIQTSSIFNGEVDVTIDRNVIVKCSESILASSANASTVRLLIGSINASYSVSVIGNDIVIEPDDAPDFTFKPSTTYTLEIGPSVTDLSGNGLSNAPATFTLAFSTQPYITSPDAVTSLNLYKDALLTQGFSSGEEISANDTIYVKVTGTDGATQTQDVATVTLELSWGGSYNIIAKETASNSSGLYVGSIDLNSLPLYGFPLPKPVSKNASLVFKTITGPVQVNSLNISFPSIVPTTTVVNSLSGQTTASGATNVKIDTTITTAFTEPLMNVGNPFSLAVSSGVVDIPGVYSLSANKKNIIFTPNSDLPLESEISVSAPYDYLGLKSLNDNPLFRNFVYKFSTQLKKTEPISITSVLLYPDSSYNSMLVYSNNSDFPGTGELFVEAKGVDGSPTTIDTTSLLISGAPNLMLVETSKNSGQFRGSYSYANLLDNMNLKFTSIISSAASASLKLTYPYMSMEQPASGSTGVSVSNYIRIAVSEDIDPTIVNANNIKLFRSDGLQVSGSLNYISSTKSIVFTPDLALEFSKKYRLEIGDIVDKAGNKQLAQFISSFQTQDTTTPPSVVNSINIYSDSNYLLELVDNSNVAPSSNVFISIVANDLSATTVDTTKVKMMSNKTTLETTITLLETSINSGVFRGTSQIFSEAGAELTFSSITDTAKKKHLKTLEYPIISEVQPASGSSDIFLNTSFVITGNKNFNALYVNKDTIKLFDKEGDASYSVLLSGPKQITVSSLLATESEIILQILPALIDDDGMNFDELIASYSTKKVIYNDFRIFSDATYTNELLNGSSIEPGQILYLVLMATDLCLNVSEHYDASYNSLSETGEFLLSEIEPGKFTGSFTSPVAGSETLEIRPNVSPSLQKTLQILPSFSLKSYSPANGTTAVSADTWPTWNFTRQIDSAFVNTTQFQLREVNTGLAVSGQITLSNTGKQVRFQPSSMLKLLTDYEMVVKSTVQDTQGKLLGVGLNTQFQTQPPPNPPSVLVSLKNYETSNYATSTSVISTNGTMYLQLKAKDTSFSTIETAKVRIDSSDGTIDGVEINLVEVTPPSGVFALDYPINLPVGTEITVTSQVNTAFKTVVRVFPRSSVISINPASSSINLYLDQTISVSFNNSINTLDMTNGIVAFDSSNNVIPLSFTQTNSGKTINIAPVTQWATGSINIIQINSSLHDSNGLYILPMQFSFSTLFIGASTLELYTGIAPLNYQLVSNIKEVTRGNVDIVATTTNLFANKTETRQVNFITATGSYNVGLIEKSPGLFIGSSQIQNEFGSSMNATLNFGDSPSLNFTIASLPVLLSSNPASSAINVGEYSIIAATFTKKMNLQSSLNAVKINSLAGIIDTVSLTATDSTSLYWRPTIPMPSEASCSLSIKGLKDYLGQPLQSVLIPFSTSGNKGITLYSDASYSQEIISDDITLSVVYIEVTASLSASLDLQKYLLDVTTERNGTATQRLSLTRVSDISGKYRSIIDFENPNPTIGNYISLIPGEWIEFSSSILTDEKRKFYYKLHGSQSPILIKDINFYSEKYFAREIENVFQQEGLYIEVIAEDRNWLYPDTTVLTVYSDSDTQGFDLIMFENGLHSDSFRNLIKVSPSNTITQNNYLKVLPGDRVWVSSNADMSIKDSIKYLPENNLESVVVFPSPARGNQVTFSFYLTFPGDVELEVFDVSGDEVFSRYLRGGVGENRFKWHIPGRLANGVYFYRLKLETETAYPTRRRKARGKFAILR